MATINVDTKKIIENIKKLDSFLSGYEITWSLITKMACGNEPLLRKILNDPFIKNLHSVGDARLSNLKIVKKINPDIKTIYIKPPALAQIKNVVEYSDISLNSSLTTIKEINKASKSAGKVHQIIVMIEMGELREGVLRNNVISFYEKILNLSNVEVIGLGTNLGCMYGIEPTYDKLIQLSLYKLLLEEKFKKKLPLISGGSSITLPLISKRLPKSLNHLRIGETAFHGVSLDNGKKFRNLSTHAFNFSAEIIELEKKESVPDGKIGDAGIGHTAGFDENKNHTSYRAIVDFGSIDVNSEDLSPRDEKIKFIGTTSDMTVYNLGENKQGYKVGDKIHFLPNYMATARLLNSKYITKEII